MSGKIHPDALRDYLRSDTRERRLLEPFLQAGFDVTWAQKISIYRSNLPFYFLKPNSDLTEAFGFEYEIVLVYSPFDKLEPRTFQAVDSFVSAPPAKGRVDTLFFFLVSDDPNVVDSTTAYLLEHKEERIAIPVYYGDMYGASAGPWTVRNAIHSHYMALDRFRYVLPLEEDTYFFGRQSELSFLMDACKRTENAGLFGLRKTGKTSLLLKLGRTLKRQNDTLYYYVDCQSTSIRLRRWHELLGYICQQLSDNKSPKAAPEFSAIAAADSFSSFISDTLARREMRRVVLVFDEVEWISPSTTKDAHWNEDFSAFWHSLRSHQTQNRNLAIIIGGVNPSMVELDSINGFQNPLFGIVPSIFLSGLNRAENDDLVSKIGKVMGFRFTPDSLLYLHNQYGGHPLLTRLACSLTGEFAKVQGKQFPINVTESILRDAAPNRDAELLFYCRHIVSELERWYPQEYNLLETLAIDGYHQFLIEIRKVQGAIHLYKYGAVKDSATPYITYQVLHDYVADENARREGRTTGFRVTPLEDRHTFTHVRMRSIVEDMRTLESFIHNQSGLPFYGPNSFPEADRLFQIVPPHDANSLAMALTPLNRSFVESIDNYGRSIGKNNYFWDEVRQSYPVLHEALRRIRTYRNERQHLTLVGSTSTALRHFMESDLPGDLLYSHDRYWIIFQRCLDEFQRALQRETSAFRS